MGVAAEPFSSMRGIDFDTEVLETTMKLPTTAPQVQPSAATSSGGVGDVGRDMVAAEPFSSMRAIDEIAASSPSSDSERASGSKRNQTPEDGINQTIVAPQELDVASPEVSAVTDIGDLEVSATIQELLRLGEVLQQRPSVDSFLAS